MKVENSRKIVITTIALLCGISCYGISQEAQQKLNEIKNKPATPVVQESKPVEPKKEIKQFAIIPCTGKESVKIQAGLVYNYGGTQAVARQQFYVFKHNPLEIIRNSDLVENITDNLKSDLFLQSFSSYRESSANPYAKEIYTKSMKILEPYVVKNFETDFEGKATVEKIAPGDYFIFGSTSTRRNVAIWNLPVKIEKNHNKVIYLYKNNMLVGQ